MNYTTAAECILNTQKTSRFSVVRPRLLNFHLY